VQVWQDLFYVLCMAFSSGRGAGEAAIGLAPVSVASVQSTNRPPTPVGSRIVSASSVSAASLVAGLPIIVRSGCRFVASIPVKQQYFNRVL